MSRRRTEFNSGLHTRTPLVLVAAALAVVAALAGLQLFVSRQAFTAIPEQRMLRIPNDDYVHLSYLIADLKKHPPAGPVVYLFGGSGVMEMMRSEGGLSRAISADAAEPAQAIDLAGHNQSMGQTLAIIDNLPRGRGLLAVGVSPNRLTESPESDAGQLAGKPLALTSPHLAGLLHGYVDQGVRLPGLLPGILDFALSYTRARASLTKPWLTWVPRADHYYADGEGAAMDLRIAGSKEELAREQGLYAKYASYNLEALREIVRLGREKGYEVVLFEQPLAPEASGPGWQAYLEQYRAAVRGVAQEQGVRYIDVQPLAGLQARDFADLFHLVGEGREKWTSVFAPRLAEALKTDSSAP